MTCSAVQQEVLDEEIVIILADKLEQLQITALEVAFFL